MTEQEAQALLTHIFNTYSTASARVDELLVLAAAYDSTGALVESKACTLVGDAFVADFDTDISGCTVRGFVWQNGTLRPVR